jgi:hypothetical protein
MSVVNNAIDLLKTELVLITRKIPSKLGETEEWKDNLLIVDVPFGPHCGPPLLRKRNKKFFVQALII